MSSEAAERVDFAAALERIGKITAVIASLSLVISVFYDWGFLFALDISFAEAPTTISDHVRSWLVWLPKIATAVLFLLAFELLTRRIERGMTEEELIKSSRNPTWTERFRKSPLYAIGTLGVLIVVLWLLFGHAFADGLFLGLIVCWFLFIGWVFAHPVVRERHPAAFRLFVYWGPPVMLWFFYSGFNAAKTATAASTIPHRLQVNAPGDGSASRDARILRSFEKWLLLQESDKRIIWVRTDDVRRIERIVSEPPFQGLVCVLSGKLCPASDSGKAK